MVTMRSRSSLASLLIGAALALAAFSQSGHGQGSPQSAAASADDNKRMGELITQIAQLNQVWGAKLTTPGASLKLKLISGNPTRPFKYHLYAQGLPKDAIFSIMQWPVTQNQPSELLGGVTLNAEGLAVCAGKPGRCGSADKPDDPIDYVFNPVKGEPVRLALVTQQAPKKQAFVKIVPIPIEAVDRGCRLDAVVLMPRAEEVLIEGSGFKPGEELATNSSSAGEHLAGKSKADPKGQFFSVVLPHRKGERNGTTRFEVKAPECSPAVEFPWGDLK